jgi:hypothetical protein
MTARPLTLISEDILSEALAHRVLANVAPDAEFVQSLGKRGLGYLTSRLKNLNEAAAGMKIVAILDRDRPQNCPIQLIRGWLGGPRHPNFSIRLAEMEIESWILADRERASEFLQVPINRIPEFPDVLPDPKETLVNIARRSSSREIREGLCPKPGSAHPIGPLYNTMLETFVKTRWRASRASAQSPSLLRAQRQIRELALR